MDDDSAAQGTRTLLGIDGREVLLSAEVDLVDLMERIESAARAEPTFIDLAVDGGLMSILISSRSSIVGYVERIEPLRPGSDPDQSWLPDWDL